MEEHMKRRLYLLALSFALGAASNAFGQSPTFTQIDYPGATSTQAWGINSRGDIVGHYVSANKSSHGFLLSGGHFTSIDFPRRGSHVWSMGSTLAAISWGSLESPLPAHIAAFC